MSNLNIALPLTCYTEGTVGWEPDYSVGKLVFVDNDDYTIPNYCVRFTEGAAFELHVATLEGDDVTVVNGTIAYPRVERKRVAKITCQMLFGTDAEGTPYDSLQEGMVLNWAAITALSDLSVTQTQGLQTVEYEPYVGADPITFDAHVLPPVVGSVKMGVGMAFGLQIEVPDPTDLP